MPEVIRPERPTDVSPAVTRLILMYTPLASSLTRMDRCLGFHQPAAVECAPPKSLLNYWPVRNTSGVFQQRWWRTVFPYVHNRYRPAHCGSNWPYASRGS